MADLSPTSPLAHLGRDGGSPNHGGEGLTLSALPDLSVTLLFDEPDRDADIARILGMALPREPNSVAGGTIAWIAPGQWLAVGNPAAEPFGVDLSDAYGAIAIEGARSRSLLAKGVPLDLDSAAFAPGRCARTLMGSIPVVLLVRGPDEWLVLVERSLAHAAWTWLLDGAVALGAVERTGQDL
jgi:heterotetrameric sarcosine oxidase gamma subunit